MRVESLNCNPKSAAEICLCYFKEISNNEIIVERISTSGLSCGFCSFALKLVAIACRFMRIEKEFILKDLIIEGELGKEDKRGEVCSHWVDQILVAQNETSKTDEVNDGADFVAS